MAPSSTELRADAARNRARILDAARSLYAEEGLDVSMRQIAQRAGVGEPTLRRRFASREELVAEAFTDKVALYADMAEAALAHPDPGVSLRDFLDTVATMQLVDRGFADVLTMTFPRAMPCERQRQRSHTAMESMIERAKQAGAVREEFVAEDIVMLLLAHAGIAGGGGGVSTALSARLRAYLFDAFGLPVAGPLPAAPSPARVYRALMRLHDRTGG